MKKANIRQKVSNFLKKKKIHLINLGDDRVTNRVTKREFIKTIADELHELVEWECTYIGCHNRTYSPGIKYCSKPCRLSANQKSVKKGKYSKKCEWCGGKFQTDFSKKIFCKPVCLNEKTKVDKRQKEIRDRDSKVLRTKYKILAPKYGWPEL